MSQLHRIGGSDQRGPAINGQRGSGEPALNRDLPAADHRIEVLDDPQRYFVGDAKLLEPRGQVGADAL